MPQMRVQRRLRGKHDEDIRAVLDAVLTLAPVHVRCEYAYKHHCCFSTCDM